MMPSALDNLPRLAPLDTAADAGGNVERSTAPASFDACLHQAQSQAAAPNTGQGSPDQGADGETSNQFGDAAGTTSQTAARDGGQGSADPSADDKTHSHLGDAATILSPGTALPPTSGAETGDPGQGPSTGAPGWDDGDGSDWSPASADTTRASDPKDHKDPGDDTTATAGTAAGTVTAAPIPVAAGTETAATALPDLQPIGAAGKAVGGRLWPADSTAPPLGNPSTDENPSTGTDGQAAAGEPAAAASSLSSALPVAAAAQIGVALPGENASPAQNRKSVEAAVDSASQGKGALAAPMAALPILGSNQADAASSATLSAPPAAAVETAISAAVTTSLAGATGGPMEKADAKPAAGTAGSINVAAPSSPVQAAQAAQPVTASKTEDIGQADRVRFVQRVEQAFQSMSDQGGTVRLKLNPPELGSLRLEITVRNGAITARAETETPAARNLLLDNLPALRERLAQQDIKVQHFDVDLMDRGQGGMPGQASYSSDSSGRQGNHRFQGTAAREISETPAVADAGASVTRGSGAGNQLNIVI
jgi:flagellar hook-length control protein FliK